MLGEGWAGWLATRAHSGAGQRIGSHLVTVTVTITVVVTSTITVIETGTDTAIVTVAVSAWGRKGGNDGQRCARTTELASASALIKRRSCVNVTVTATATVIVIGTDTATSPCRHRRCRCLGNGGLDGQQCGRAAEPASHISGHQETAIVTTITVTVSVTVTVTVTSMDTNCHCRC